MTGRWRASGAEYCPIHEFDWPKCCRCCVDKKEELRRIDNQLRVHWFRVGLSFEDRGRSRGFAPNGTPYQKHRA